MVAARAVCTAVWNGRRNTSRISRSAKLVGPQFVPLFGWPCTAKCLAVASTRSA